MPPPDRARGLPWHRLICTVSLVVLWRAEAAEPSPRAHQPLPGALESVHAPEGSVASPPDPAPPPGVIWGGCDEIERSSRGPPLRCVLHSDVEREWATLRVWLPSSVKEPTVSLDGVVVTDVDTVQVHEGSSLHVVPDHGGRLRVTGMVEAEPQELLALDVDLRPRPDAKLRKELDDAAHANDRSAQRAMAEGLREALEGELPPPERLMLTQYLQYVTFDLGDHREAADHALEVARLAHEQGKPLAECDALWSASFLLGDQLGDEQPATARLKTGCSMQAAVPSVDMMAAYYEGLRALNQGRLASAERSLVQALQLVRRLRWPRWELKLLNPLVETLAARGRFDWARLSLGRVRELDVPSHHVGLLDGCEVRARYHRKLGSLAQREAELRGGSLAQAAKHWRDALEVVRDRTQCPDHPSVHDQAQRLSVDLARAAVELGELEQARAILDALPRRAGAAVTDVRRRLVRAELALARGDLRAASRVLEDLAADRRRGKLALALAPEDEWRLHWARARVHHARRELTAAIEALAEAQAAIDHSRSLSGMETDRQAAMRRESSELLVRLLLSHGHERQALCAARVARARALAGQVLVPEGARERLGALERTRAELFTGYKWYDPRDIPLDEQLDLHAKRRALEATLPEPLAPVECDQLPVAAPGEASLLYFHTGDGFVGFAWNERGHVVVRDLSQWAAEHPPQSLGDVLISPFTRVLEGATRVRVLAPASMGEVSFAELPWRGRPLGDRLAVVYALDLPAVPSATPDADSVALLFSDPKRDLLGRYDALHERFGLWRAMLEAKGLEVIFDVRPSAAPAIASAADVLARTRGVGLALLYGFGVIAPSSHDPRPTGARPHDPDRDGFGAGADVITRSDVLLETGQVPRRVILAHCNSATVDLQGFSGAIGLAQSYVQAGSEWAVGAIGDVPPASMQAIVEVLLEALPPRASVDEVAMALQRAKLALRARGLPDTTHLRLWVR